MNLQQALEESEALVDELLELLDLPLCNDSKRVETAWIACSLALEHWHAVRALLAIGLLPSALVVHRSQYETILRSVWLTYAASDDDVAKLSAELDLASEKQANNGIRSIDMLNALSKSGPEQAHAALARFRKHSWAALNSYAHAGIHPLRRHADGYPIALAHNVLCNANGLGILSAMQAAVLFGAQPLQRVVLDLAAKHPNCMPAPL